MVPMTVHQVVADISGRLVQVCMSVNRLIYMALDIADVHDLLLVRRELELTDASRHIAYLALAAQCPFALLHADFRCPYLAALDVGDMLSVAAPSGIHDALA